MFRGNTPSTTTRPSTLSDIRPHPATPKVHTPASPGTRRAATSTV
ncbi:hypothetical protein ACFQVA_39915 [Actinomadura keratinilytica]